MNATDPTSLTPQERDLAQQLAQIAPRGEPSPALDARILAAAREADVSAASTSTIPATTFPKPISMPRRIRRRWPVVLGVAASMVLALGVAWRMQPLPGARQVQRSTAAPAMHAPITSTQIPIELPVENQAENTPPAVQSPDTLTSHARAASLPADEPESVPAPPAQEEPSIVQDAPSSQDALPAAAKAAAPGALPAPAARQASGTMAGATPVPPPPAPPNGASQPAMAVDRAQNQAQQADSNTLKSTAQHNATASNDEPADDVPPATADAPAVRDAWLQRIGSLIRDGNTTDARSSLHAFVRRYPTYPLPEDLKALVRDSANPP